MFTSRFTKLLRLTLLLLSTTAMQAAAQVRPVLDKIDTPALLRLMAGPYTQLPQPVGVRSAVADGSTIRVRLTDDAAMLLLTPDEIRAAQDSVRRWCGMPGADVRFMTSRADLKDLTFKRDATHGRPAQGSPVSRVDDGFGGALSGRNIALWPSHGRYYEPSLGRWEWQRARLFTTVEDLLTPSIVLPFLIPMLENAGALVLTPRERDTTRVSVVVDDADEGYTATRHPAKTVGGFGRYATLKGKDNPFTSGEAHIYTRMELGEDSITFRGTTGASGPMEVYIAYATVEEGGPAGGVDVTVRHGEGEAHYRVDQSRGGGMWMPLGRLPFRRGREWEVVIKGEGAVSADAVRIGGGMGVVERDGETSGMPAWAEAARYYMQADGFDYAKVLSLSDGGNEYTDDINGRGEWVNALVDDKRIAVDLSLALHTDAMYTPTDSTIGTLALFTTKKDGSVTFPDGRSRQLSRQLAGAVSASVLSDIRRTWDADWTFRGMADKRYAESRRPDVPSLLLELLSHQNIADMRKALHPAFRRDVARAIYKGVARFLCGPDVSIAPLPPSHVELRFAAQDSVEVRWEATVDSLEPSAVAERFAVYEGGRLACVTGGTSVTLHQAEDGLIRTYSVVAIGPGGRSMPSESLPACLWQGGKRALLVEGMDRLSAPDFVQTGEWGGVATTADAGVPWPGDVYTTGDQFDFDPSHDWEDDDAPGHGASYADMEMEARHGGATRGTGHSAVARMLRMGGYSFVSQSKEAYDADTTAYGTEGFDLVRINLDRQRTTSYGDAGTRHSIYTAGFRRHTEAVKASGCQLVVSGCHIGTDATDQSTMAWCASTLGFKPRTGHASRSLELRMQDKGSAARWMRTNMLTTEPERETWHVSVDAVEPARAQARTVCRYADTQMSAAVEFENVVVAGF